MNKPVVGIISQNNINDEGRCFFSKTNFSVDLKDSVYSVNAIPIGLLLPLDENDFKSVNVDGYIFQGENIIRIEQIMAMHYAIRSGKPILGICMGMQTMALYNCLYKVFNGNIDYKEAKCFLETLKEGYYLKKVYGHDNCNPFYIQDMESSLHQVNLEKGSQLYNLFGNQVMMPSMHNYAVSEEAIGGELFQVTGRANDGVIEVIEGNGFDALEVQFHPEILEDKTIFDDYVRRIIKK